MNSISYKKNQVKYLENGCQTLIQVITKLLIVGVCLISFNKESYAQDSLGYRLNTTKVDMGITLSTSLLAYGIELSVPISRRVSKNLILEAKPLFGLLISTFQFDGPGDRSQFIYGGGTFGINIGKRKNFFEMTLGAAYLNSIHDSYNTISPVGTIGYKLARPNANFRIGVGYPHGVYVGWSF